MKVIFVNFAENNNHGCDQHCPFCEWSKINYGIYYSPSKEYLDKLHLVSKEGEEWQISGGGDPLYNYSKNKNELFRICNYAHELGHSIQILTHKVDVVYENYEELKNYVDKFYFSVGPIPSESLINLYYKYHVSFPVNTVLNMTSSDIIDWEKVKDIIDRYLPYVIFISFRNNFIHPLENKEEIKSKLKEISRHVFFTSDVNALCLFNGELLTCKQIDKKYFNVN